MKINNEINLISQYLSESNDKEKALAVLYHQRQNMIYSKNFKSDRQDDEQEDQYHKTVSIVGQIQYLMKTANIADLFSDEKVKQYELTNFKRIV